jgi:hypothetical protein
MALMTPSAACSFGWWLVLICSERKVLLAGCWWLICSERKYCWLGADKPRNASTTRS